MGPIRKLKTKEKKKRKDRFSEEEKHFSVGGGDFFFKFIRTQIILVVHIPSV